MQLHRYDHAYDVVVVGAGAAGLRAALEASASARTAVLSKLHPVRSLTGAAQAGINAALGNATNDADSWEQHAADTIAAGDRLVDQEAAAQMCRAAPEAVRELERFGLPFSRTAEGRIRQRGAGSLRRAAVAGELTGHHLLQTLFQQCLHAGVEFFDEFYALDLIFGAGGVGAFGPAPGAPAAGVIGYELSSGELHAFSAPSVVLAAGGCGRIFATTSNGHSATGDAMALALRSGLPLQDMEFLQFHPTGLHRLGIVVPEGARVEGAVLRNGSADAFMERYAPLAHDLAPADIVSRAIVTELREGRGSAPGDHVVLDLTQLPSERWGSATATAAGLALTQLGIDAEVTPLPVHPTAHYAMGGIPTTADGHVLGRDGLAVPGLFAAGEAACVSVHGANRLPANGLLEAIVFGQRAGAAAAAHARATPGQAEAPAGPSLATGLLLEQLRNPAGSERSAPIRAALQRTMDQHASVVRSEESLAQAAADLTELKKRYQNVAITDQGRRYNTDLTEAIELGFLLDVADALVTSAAARRESRGAHFRTDYPSRDDVRYEHHTLAYRAGPINEQIELGSRPVDVSHQPPTERSY
jgi:succinate dehydrogenase / fumarate reductase flavoprotein subunit